MVYDWIANRVIWLLDDTIFEDYIISYIYLCVIKVEGYVTFLYEDSMYIYIYIYYVYVAVYVNLQVEVMKSFNVFEKFDLWM